MALLLLLLLLVVVVVAVVVVAVVVVVVVAVVVAVVVVVVRDGVGRVAIVVGACFRRSNVRGPLRESESAEVIELTFPRGRVVSSGLDSAPPGQVGAADKLYV